MFPLGKSSSKLVYFNIIIDTPYKNVLLIQNSPYSSDTVNLSGRIVFSLMEGISVRRIGLCLLGCFKLEFLQIEKHNCSRRVSHFKEEQVALKVVWENLLISSEGHISKLGEDSNSSLTPPGSPYFLNRGNHEFPFYVQLPHDVPETVEGLQTASLLYQIKASIERGGFKNSLNAHTYLRVFRTPYPESSVLNDEVSVSKFIANKLQYRLLIPERGLCLGGTTPIHVYLFPFQKNIHIKHITATLIQCFSFQDSTGRNYTDETPATVIKLETFDEIEGIDTFQYNALIDATHVILELSLSSKLKSLTQSCHLRGNMISVWHKLYVCITLDSMQIKATLPVFLYITPQHPVKGRRIMVDNSGKFHIRSGVQTLLFNTTAVPQYIDEMQLSSTHADNESNGSNLPPSYELRVHDQLYTGAVLNSNPMQSPVTSCTQVQQWESLNRVPSYKRHQEENENLVPVNHLAPVYSESSSSTAQEVNSVKTEQDSSFKGQ